MPGVSVGIALPVREVAILGAHDAAPLIQMARQVEELGFDSVWVGDSFVARQRLEPLTLLAAIAMVTNEVEIGTAALTAVLREPLTLAHAIVTLDQLSGGRLRLGIGTGQPLPVKSEYDAVSMSFRERAGRVDEAVRLFKKAWNNVEGDLKGEYFDLIGMRMQTPPSQPGGPPLWLATDGKPKGVTRTATLYDGWMPILLDPAEYGTRLKAIREEAEAAGRDPQAITPALYTTVHIDNDVAVADAGLNDYTHRYNNLPLKAMSNYQLYFGGSEKAFVDWLTEYVEAGARHIILRVGSFDEYDSQVRALAEGVLPAIHALNVD
jgi:alkanesulfonate monooxygenase SsuD/methylene tetrahydromethanopterin reductase-like flavin-dependent oxidoreductase (luciferase family)